jgi:hypothetical protein
MTAGKNVMYGMFSPEVAGRRKRKPRPAAAAQTATR